MLLGDMGSGALDKLDESGQSPAIVGVGERRDHADESAGLEAIASDEASVVRSADGQGDAGGECGAYAWCGRSC